MPGPGGGSRGGGFGGGSNRGGNFGGSYRGGYRGGYYRPRYGFYSPFFGYRAPLFGYGGGCLGGLLSMLITPFIILFISIFMIMSVFGSLFRVSQGGKIAYNEPKLQEFANVQYAKEFGDSSAYEDNILIVFLANEKRDGYYTIAWIGDNVSNEINEMFGNEYTAFGIEMLQNIPDYYEYSISKNLASVVDGMADRIERLNVDSFENKSNHSNMTKSHITNLSSIEINDQTINSSLLDFTERTEIPIVIVVEDMDEVFNKVLSIGDVFVLIIAGGVATFAIVMLVKSIRNGRKSGDYVSDEEFRQDEN